MTSKERVMAVFDGKLPDRIPRWCGASPEFWEKAKRDTGLDDEALRIRLGDDFRQVFSVYRGPSHELADDATWESPFGIQRRGIGYGQPTSHPLAKAASVEEIDAYPWHDAIDLVGHENLYFMMYDHPETTLRLFERITDYYVEASRRVFEEAADLIDIFFIGNDLGSQNGPLLGEELFAQFLMPSFRRLIDLGHSYDLPVMLHCCGGYRQLIPMLIEAGLDGLHALQPDATGMDPAGLKADFGGQIVLNGAIDSHHILIDGSGPDFVRDRTREIVEIMKPGGKYIGGASHDTILEETPTEHVLAMMDAIQEFGAYP